VRVNIGDDLAALCSNLMNVGRVTPEISLLNSIQQASISTRVSLTTSQDGGTARHCGDSYSVLFYY